MNLIDGKRQEATSHTQIHWISCDVLFKRLYRVVNFIVNIYLMEELTQSLSTQLDKV